MQCTTVMVVGTAKYYLYSLLKMAEESINELLPKVSYDPPKSEVKRQKLIECALNGNSKQYLGKSYTEEQVNKLSAEEVDKIFSNYEAKLSGQMIKSLGKLIIRMYLMGACAILEMTNQDALSDNLESNPFLNSALQRSMCELYHRFGSFLMPLSVRLITSRHDLSERCIKNGGTNEGDQTSATPSKYAGLEAAITAELMIGFWFGVGVILAVGVVDGLNHLVVALKKGK